MKFNYNKLRGRIVEKFGTIGKLAENVDISFESISKKLNNKVAFAQQEIMVLCKLLDIPIEDIGIYFFTLEVQMSEL